MKYQTPELQTAGAASALIQLKTVSGSDGMGNPFTKEAVLPSIESGN